MDSYLSRLLWMSLASFFLVHLVMGFVVSWITSAAIAVADGMRPASAARFLLAVRLFPCGFAILTVAALCVPSYLWLEPDNASEQISVLCFLAAALCVAIWSISLGRGMRAVSRSRRYLRHCRNTGRKMHLPGHPAAGWVMDGAGHSIGLAGILRPRVVVAKGVWNALSREQLEAALRHEWAHATSRDNLKKLLTLLIPDVLPFVRARFSELDRAWARFAERAADDRAAAGDLRRSVSLAAALVSVARMGIPQHTTPLMTSLVSDAAELSNRVERLLESKGEESKKDARGAGWGMPLVGAGILLVALFSALMLAPSTLYAVHELLEALAR